MSISMATSCTKGLMRRGSSAAAARGGGESGAIFVGSFHATWSILPKLPLRRPKKWGARSGRPNFAGNKSYPAGASSASVRWQKHD